MKTKQFKSLAGASILSLFLTGCVQASGGVELPPGSVVSANKLENVQCSGFAFLAITADGEKALALSEGLMVYSEDGLKTFTVKRPNITCENNVTAYQNKFYAVKMNTADYYSSENGRDWIKEGSLGTYHDGDSWRPLISEKADSLGFANTKTGKRKYIKNPPKDIIEAPAAKKNRVYLERGDNVVIAYDANKYDGLSISYDKGKTWEHLDNLFPQYKYDSANDGYVRVTYHNKIFYLWYTPLSDSNKSSKGYYISSNGKNWQKYRSELKNVKYILPVNQGLLLVYADDKRKNTFIENLTTPQIKQTINNFSCFDCKYYPQINSVVLAGTKTDGSYNGALYLMPTEGILTGSGIVDFQCNKQFLAARFGNGLQVLVTPFLGSISAYPFVDEPFSITDSLSGSTTLKIGRWF